MDDLANGLLAWDQRVQDFATVRLGNCVENIRGRRGAGHGDQDMPLSTYVKSDGRMAVAVVTSRPTLARPSGEQDGAGAFTDLDSGIP